MGFGGGMGGFSIGPSSVQANAEAGLPFAELPLSLIHISEPTRPY